MKIEYWSKSNNYLYKINTIFFDLRRQTYNSSDQSTIREEGWHYKGASTSAHSQNINLACDNSTGLRQPACLPSTSTTFIIITKTVTPTHQPTRLNKYQFLSLYQFDGRDWLQLLCVTLSGCTAAQHLPDNISKYQNYLVSLSHTLPILQLVTLSLIFHISYIHICNYYVPM